MMLLVSSVHILTVYVALELSSYSLYVLVSLRRQRELGFEAGLKYFLVGVSASAVMLFGMALLYGALQAAYIVDLVRALPAALNAPLVAVGLMMTLCGFFFKLAVFPFHFWAPDAYQGGAHQVAAYLATASKVAAIAVLVRMVAAGGGHTDYLAQVLVVLAVVSMTVGNLVALVQQDLKRMLAYSSIAHAGYVLIGVLSMSPAGYSAAVFYAVSLLMMKYACFMVVVAVAWDGGNLKIEQLAGLHRTSPLMALVLMVALFGLAGIPPTIGFTGKLLVFSAAMQKGYFSLVLVGMINVVISLYYYLQVLRAAYLQEPSGEALQPAVSAPIRCLAVGLVAAMVIAGIYPKHLIQLAEVAVRALM